MSEEIKKTEKPKFKLPFSALLLYLLLAAVLLSGITFSKYVTGTTLGDTARVAYMKDITIKEEGNFTKPNEWIITPGVDMKKNAAVNFEGSEMACYVFLKIKTSGWQRLPDNYSYAYKINGSEALGWQVAKGWSFLTGDENETVYYTIVPAKTPLTAPVIADDGKITVSDGLTKTMLDNMKNFSIEIEATAVQYHGFTENTEYTEQQRAYAAWEIVKNK